MSFKSGALLVAVLAVPTFVSATYGHSHDRDHDHDHGIKSASICPAYCKTTVTTEVTKTIFASCTQSLKTTSIPESGSDKSAAVTDTIAPFSSAIVIGSVAPVYTLAINSTVGPAASISSVQSLSPSYIVNATIQSSAAAPSTEIGFLSSILTGAIQSSAAVSMSNNSDSPSRTSSATITTLPTTTIPFITVIPSAPGCHYDNCLRQYLQNPTVLAFCATYTTTINTVTTGLPDYVSMCRVQPAGPAEPLDPSAISSACSCVTGVAPPRSTSTIMLVATSGSESGSETVTETGLPVILTSASVATAAATSDISTCGGVFTVFSTITVSPASSM